MANFTGPNGVLPGADPFVMTLGKNGDAYGITYRDEVYRFQPSNGSVKVCETFGGPSGEIPVALARNSEGVAYGAFGGLGDVGNWPLFRIETNGAYSAVESQPGSNGLFLQYPVNRLFPGPNGVLYGTTNANTPNNEFAPPGDEIFSYDPSTNLLSDLTSTTGATGDVPGYSITSILVGSDGNLYGTIDLASGAHLAGSAEVFKLTPGGLFSVVSTSSPTAPVQAIVQGTNGDLYFASTDEGANSDGAIFKVTLPSGTVKDIVDFTGSGGGAPGKDPTALTATSAGGIYGACSEGGASNDGVLFKIVESSSAYTPLVQFTGATGSAPGSSPFQLLQAHTGNLYGMAFASQNIDEVFSVADPSGSPTFTAINSAVLGGAIQLGSDGNIFGASPSSSTGSGLLFEVNTSTNVVSTLYTFSALSYTSPEINADGASLSPRNIGNIQLVDLRKNLVGTAPGGGAYGVGTAFSLPAP